MLSFPIFTLSTFYNHENEYEDILMVFIQQENHQILCIQQLQKTYV
jgi:hypothetical protein